MPALYIRGCTFETACGDVFEREFISFTADIDECSKAMDNNCNVSATCKDTFGSFMCSCKTGYIGNGVNCNSKYHSVTVSAAHSLTVLPPPSATYFNKLQFVWSDID